MIGAVWARVRAERVPLLAAALSYYLLASLLPLLVLAAGVLGLVSGRNGDVAPRVVEWLGIEGPSATLVQDSITHAEQRHVTTSIIGTAGMVWASLAVTGALRRTVDAVWGAADVGWTARFRSIPWTIVTVVLIAGSLVATGLVASIDGIGGAFSALLGFLFTAAVAAWFLARLGPHRPSRQALLIATIGLTIGIEAVKNGAVFVVPHLVSRESALYGGLGSALAALVTVLITSWLLLLATAVAAELSLAGEEA